MTASKGETQQLLLKAIQLSTSSQPVAAINILKTYISNDNRLPEPLLLLIEWLLDAPELTDNCSFLNYEELLCRNEWQSDYRVLHQRGRCAETRGKLIEAEKFYKEAIKAGAPPTLSKAQLAATYIKQRRWSDAITELEQLIKAEPKRLDLQCNYGIALLRSNRIQEALSASKHAINLMENGYATRKESANVWLNHGTILQESGDRKKAYAAVNRAIKLDPKIPNGLTNLGLLAHLDRDLNKAKANYIQSLKQSPGDNLASINLSGVLLAQGGKHSKEGWEYYEERLSGPTRLFSKPKGRQRIWRGEELPGALVLVHEQGLGDSFQFIRYAQDLRRLGFRCWFQGPKKLHKIFLYSGLIERCLDEQEELPPEVASWSPLLSLPFLINKEISPQGPCPPDGPYLKTSSLLIKKWKSNLGKNKKLRVALHWQGNPDHEFALSRGRSLPLEKLEPLISISGIECISLQKGPGSEQMNKGAFVSKWNQQQGLISETWGFEDTAAILCNCDLVISSDSGLAHLAGGLGIQVWLLLSWLPEWRWGLYGDRTGWYEKHRLYRQSQENDWSSVIHKLKNDLTALTQKHSNSL